MKKKIKEIWKKLPGFCGSYFVSDRGRIRGRRKSVLKLNTNQYGYKSIVIYHKKLKKTFHRRVNRLVALVFHGKPKNKKLQALHKDNNCSNNFACNIRWGTHLDNERDKDLAGRRPIGVRHALHKLNLRQVKFILRAPRYYGFKRDLARKFNVSRAAIKAIRTRRTWKWVKT